MPVEHAGFPLKPDGVVDRKQTVGLALAATHCAQVELCDSGCGTGCCMGEP